MNFKTLTALFSFLTALLLVAGCGAGSNDSEESGEIVTLKLASHTPAESTPTKNAIEPFMERVTELTEGQVEFDFYPGEQLGKGPDAISLASGGTSDISYFTPNFTPSEMPIGSALVSIPGLVEDPVKGSRALLKVAQESPMLESEFLEYGVRPLSMFITPSNEVFTNGKEIKTPDDLTGYKIRSGGGVYTDALDFIDSTPTQIPSNDVYNAYSSGVVDGVLVFPTGLEDYGWDELTKYGTKGLNFGVGPLGFAINEDVYQDLSSDIQDALLQAGEEISKSYTEYSVEQNNKAFDKLIEDEDITIYELSDSDEEEWDKVYDEFKESFLEDVDNEEFENALKMLEKELEN